MGAIVNVLLRAGLLAVSLTALSYGRNVMPPWVAVVMAVGGILLLAITVSAVPEYRNLRALFSKELSKIKDLDRPDDDDR